MNFQSLCHLLEERSQNRYTQIKILHLSGNIDEISYQSLYEKAKIVAANLQAQGIQPGSAIALLLPTCTEFLYSFFGIQLAGCIPVAIYPPLRLGVIDEWLVQAKKQLSSVQAQAVLTNKIGTSLPLDVPFGCLDAIKIATSQEKKFSPTPIHKYAFIQFSSGTTGVSKPVCISHRNVLENSIAIINTIANGIKSDPKTAVTVSWLPLYHDMGLVGALMTSILANSQLILIRPEEFIGYPLVWLKAISDYKANITVAPNFGYGLCVRRLNDEQRNSLDLSCLQVALCGAEMIHPQTIQEFNEKFASCGLSEAALTPVYGLAEATLAVTFSDPSKLIEWTHFKASSLQPGLKVEAVEKGTALADVGKPIEKTEVEIRNDDDKVLPEGTVGSIWVRSPSIMEEYYGQPELTAEAKKGSFLHTGDYGFFFQERLFITGRKKEILNVRGQKYDPSLVERSLLIFDELREGCAVAFSSRIESSDSEELFVVTELKKGIKLTAEQKTEIERKIIGKISSDHMLTAKRVEFVPSNSLPRTSSGKIKRNLTKQMWEQGLLNKKKGLFDRAQRIIKLVRNMAGMF